MVEGQKVKIERPCVVHLVFCEVSFDAERARELAEVNIESASNGHNVGAIRLKDVAIDFRPGLVRRISLQGLRGLAKLEIKADSISSAGRYIRIEGEDDIRLIDAERIAQDVIGTEVIDAPGG